MNTEGNTKLHVISNEEQDRLGNKGGFSRARKIIATIEFDAKTANPSYTSENDLAVRIKNTKEAQSKRDKDHPYDTKEAENEQMLAKHFSHLGMKKPIHVKKDKYEVSFFKSYSVMNKLPGKDAYDACGEFYDENNISTKQFIDVIAHLFFQHIKNKLLIMVLCMVISSLQIF